VPRPSLKSKRLSRVLIRCAALVCLLIATARGQHYNFASVSAGLGNLTIICSAQDSDGYLWFGTENGLYRFDGAQFTLFGAAQGLGARTIQALLATADGTLLVGSTQGVYARDRSGNFQEVTSGTAAGHRAQRIGSSFTILGPGRVLMVDFTGLYQLQRDGTGRWAAAPFPLAGHTTVWSVLAAPDGSLWYGCDEDLCHLDHGHSTPMAAALHLPRAQWLRLLFDPAGHLWLRGNAHLGEIDLARRRYTEHPLPGHASLAPYAALTQDHQGNILAAQGSSFGIQQHGRWRMVTPGNGLPRYDISSLTVDREGNFWIGSLGHGLLRWIGRDLWESYTAGDGLTDELIWSAQRGPAGRLWIGTESGLHWIPPSGGRVRRWSPPGLEHTRVLALTIASDGNLWFSSSNNQLHRVDTHSLAGRSWQTPNVSRIINGPDHRLWIATAQGLYTIDPAAPGSGPRLVEDPSFAQPRMRFTDLDLDRAGNLWACTDASLYRLNAHGWARIDPGMTSVQPRQIAAARDGSLWTLGTFTGLMHLRVTGNTIVEAQHITRPQLLSDQIVSLLVDSRGWLWVGQDAGLTVFDGQHWRGFTQDDGLAWNDQDSYALSEDTDHSLWIGTSGGLSHLLRPDEALAARTTHPPALEQINFGSTAIVDGNQLRWHRAPLEIELAPMNFREAHRLHFRYRLRGLETDWVETSNGFLRYPALPPGQYTFEAVLADAAGLTVSSPVQISFRIAPCWWQTRQAKLAAILLAAALLTLLWRWRIRKLVAQKYKLEKSVAERTRDLENEKNELLRTREQLRHIAEHDDLTGLLNHRVILDRLHAEIERAQRSSQPLSLLMIDLDHFKQVNDSFGHLCGDAVLKQVGAILQDAIRSYDWAGRYGGEEFLLIQPTTSFDAARQRADQIRLALASALVHDGLRTVAITASFGVVAGFPSDAQTMIRMADDALYRAKNNGRNCVVAVEIIPTMVSATA